ncbi:MAG: YebC/PmpR family DNA-binding transcriptional regulator [bacterium]|nr:YebC/PmpR family DNA-binding transcriptional regulator [bacterium]
MSGHSKWSQIKHKKAITDKKKGKVFSKLVREIMIAAKTGGGTNANVRLRSAIERAKAEGVAKDNIERAVAKGTGASEGQDFKEFLYEATGPGGVAILIEGITDSTNRTIAEIKHLLSKNNGRISEPGSLLWNFQKVGILEVSVEQNASYSKNDIELAFIESGARDFSQIENDWIVETDYTTREQVRKQLEEKSIIIKSSNHDYKPGSTVTLDEQTLTSVEALLETLTDHDDVQEVYTNIE